MRSHFQSGFSFYFPSFLLSSFPLEISLINIRTASQIEIPKTFPHNFSSRFSLIYVNTLKWFLEIKWSGVEKVYENKLNFYWECEWFYCNLFWGGFFFCIFKNKFWKFFHKFIFFFPNIIFGAIFWRKCFTFPVCRIDWLIWKKGIWLKRHSRWEFFFNKVSLNLEKIEFSWKIVLEFRCDFGQKMPSSSLDIKNFLKNFSYKTWVKLKKKMKRKNTRNSDILNKILKKNKKKF